MASQLKVYRCRIESRMFARSREEVAMMFIEWLNVSEIASLTVVCEEETGEA